MFILLSVEIKEFLFSSEEMPSSPSLPFNSSSHQVVLLDLELQIPLNPSYTPSTLIDLKKNIIIPNSFILNSENKKQDDVLWEEKEQKQYSVAIPKAALEQVIGAKLSLRAAPEFYFPKPHKKKTISSKGRSYEVIY